MLRVAGERRRRASGSNLAANRVDEFDLAWRVLLAALTEEARARKTRSDAAYRQAQRMAPNAAATWQSASQRDFSGSWSS